MKKLLLAVSTAIVLSLVPAFAATGVYKGATGTDLTAGASWTNGVVPNSSSNAVWYGSSLGAGLTLGSSQSWGSMAITNAASDISVTGAGTLTLGASGIDMSASAVNMTWGNPLTLGASQTWNVTSGKTLMLNGAVGDGGSGYNITKIGLGTLVLGGASTFAGNINVTNGTLRTIVNKALPPTATLNFNMATNVVFDITNTAQIFTNMVFTNVSYLPSITITGVVGSALAVSPTMLNFAPLASGSNLTVNIGSVSTFTYTNSAGTLAVASSSGNTSAGGGTVNVILSKTNVITATSVNVGSASGGSGTMPSAVLYLGQSNIINSANINLGNSGSRSQGTIQFTNGLTNPTLTIAGATGGGSLSTLVVSSHDSFQASDHPTDTFDSTLGTLYAQFGSVTIGRASPTANSTGRGITITSNLKMGAGTLNASSMTLGQVNSQSNVTNDTINITALFSMTNSGVANVTNLTFANNQLAPPGAGSPDTITLNCTVGMTNGVTLNSTTIQKGAAASTATTTAQINWGDGTIGNNGGTNLSISGVTVALLGTSTTHKFNISSGQGANVTSVMSGAGTLTKAGAGSLTNAAANTYTGGTTLSAGTLNVGATETAGTSGPLGASGTITFAGGTLQYSSADTYDYSGRYSAAVNQAYSIDSGGQSVIHATPLTSSGGTLNKVGAGTLALTATNTYTGATTISGGTLSIGGAGELGSSGLYSGLITNNSVLSFDSLAAQTFSGVISGTGSLIQDGTGTLTLNAANTYSGTTTVEGSTLTFGNSGCINNNSQLILSNSTINIAINTALTNFVAGTFVNTGSTNLLNITFVPGMTYPAQLTLVLYGTASGLVDGGNNLTNLGLVLPPAGNPAGYLTNNTTKGSIDLVLTAGPVLNVPITWNGQTNGINVGVWDILTTSDWVTTSDGVTPYPYQDTATVLFNDTAAGATTVNLAAAVAPGSLTVSNNALPYTFTGTGKISGTTSLIKQGTGTLTLSETGGDNFSGGVTVSGGEVVFDNAGTTVAGGLAIASGATVQIGNNDTAGTLPSGTITNNGILLATRTDSVTVAGAITGTGSVTNVGSGTLVLGAANSYTGGTTVNNGTVQMNAAGAAGTGTITLGTNILALNIGSGILTNPVVGSGTINITEISGASTVLGGSLASFTGVLNIPASPGGTAKTAINSAVPSINSAATINIASGGTLYLNGSTVVDAATNNVSGPGNSENIGALRMDSGAIISGPVNLLGNTAIGVYSGSSTIGSTISDNGNGYGINYGTSGTLTLSGTNTYTGPTTVTNGTINVTGNEQAATGGWHMPVNYAGATVNFQAGSTVVVGTNAYVQVGSSPTAGTPNSQTMNTAGIVTNYGSLLVGRGGVFNVNNGGLWVQYGGVTNNPPSASGYSAAMTVNAGGTFVYNGTNSIMLTSAALNGGLAVWTLNGGSLITGQGILDTNTILANSDGYSQLVVSNNGSITLTANIPEFTTGINSNSTPLLSFGAGGANFNTAGFSTVISNTIGGVGGLNKLGLGTLTLTTTNIYAGITTVSNGTLLLASTGTISTNATTVAAAGILGGSGIIYGAVNIQTGGTLAPGLGGSDTSSLAVSNSLTLSGTAQFVIDRDNTQNAAQVIGVKTATYGGTLILTNMGSALVVGDTFKLVQATNYTGSFASIVLPALATGLIWNTNNLTVNGSVSVQKSPTILTLTSSENPSGFGDSLTFAGTLDSTNPTGTITFQTNGVTFDIETVTNGAATSVAIASLPRATVLITALYSGDAGYLSTSTNLNQVVTNHPPVVQILTVTRTAGLSLKIALSDLATNWTDADGDSLVLSSLNTSTNGATPALTGGYVFYDNANNVNDQFSYVVSDGQGGYTTGLVNVVVNSTSLFGQNSPSITTSNGAPVLNFAGVPGYSYSVQVSTNLTDWSSILTTNAPSNGLFQFIDNSAPQPAAYYRLQWNP